MPREVETMGRASPILGRAPKMLPVQELRGSAVFTVSLLRFMYLGFLDKI